MELYKESIEAIREYFGVSEQCANYLYYRAFRSKQKNDKYLKWDVKVQNALVKLDKYAGVMWNNVKFGEENKTLVEYMINLDDDKIFRWIDDDEEPQSDSEWKVIINKKKNKKENSNILKLIKRPGLYF